MKSKRIEVQINVNINTSFGSYGDKVDKRIIKSITRWIRNTLEMDCSYIPLYPGDAIEDSTYKSKIKVELE